MVMANFKEAMNYSCEEFYQKIGGDVSKILGLDELETRIYLCLLRSGPMTASTIAKKLNVDRAKTYRIVDKMISVSLISTTFTSPKLCIPLEPREAFKLVLKKREDEINIIKKLGDKIIPEIDSMLVSTKDSLVPTFRIVKGRTNIYSEIEELIENSSGIVYIVTTLEDISRMYHSNVPEKIKKCEQRGGQIRLLLDQVGDEHLPFVSRFNATETRFFELPSKGRIIVEKDKQMVMTDASATDPTKMNSDNDFSLCTNSPEMVGNIFILCTFLWDNAKPMKETRISKIHR